jgi:peptidoglycan-associated lipoprotein
MNKLITTTAICLSLAACSSTGPTQPAAVEPAPRVDTLAAKTQPVAAAETEAQKLNRLLVELLKKSIYFDYDNFTLKPQYQEVVQKNADFMKQFGKDSVVLEGNTDERGSKEYNLALGQKRAEAVRKALMLVGIPDTRIEAISYGEEKPRASCQEEKCWQENRRVDFTHK